MTSDRGNSGGAEMQLSNTPVTPKAPGLNPNALEFQSKTPATPLAEPPTATLSPASSPNWPDGDAGLTNVITIEQDSADPQGFAQLNGDVGKLPVSGVTFPPTPDSPDQLTAPLTTDFSSVNGTMAGEILFPTASDGSDVPEGPMEGTIPEDQLRAMLKTQLEYYFSRENLANDSYLVSQMDADQYVPINTVAGFNQVKRLTDNNELVVEILRESPNVQVDEKGEKVRPLHKRCVVILREIPDTTPLEEVEKLFSGVNCPRFVSCEFAHNNSWYVTFEGDEDAQRAYQYLREDVRTFLGRPIMARIKAKPLLRSTFVPKNGFKQNQQYDPNTIYPQQQQQQAQPAQQPTQPAQQRFTYTQVPNTTQYTLGQQSYPFFPPTNTMMHSWPNPMPFFDPGTKKVWTSGADPSSATTTTSTTTTNTTLDLANDLVNLASLYHRVGQGSSRAVNNNPSKHDNSPQQQQQQRQYQAFAANGYTPTGTFKQPSSSSHRGYQNIRSRGNQNNKPHSRNQGNQDRQDSRPSHDRHGPMSTTRSSPRSDQSHMGGSRGRNDRHGSSHGGGSAETSHSSHGHMGHGGHGGGQGGGGHHSHHHHHQHHSQHHHHNNHQSSASMAPSASASTGNGNSPAPATTTNSSTNKEVPHASTTTTSTSGSSSVSGSTMNNTNGPHATPAVTSGSTSTTTSATADVSADTTNSTTTRGQQQQHSDAGSSIPKDGLGPRRGDRYRSRRRREEDNVKGPRSAGPHPPVKEPKPAGETPKFELEATSFPPLPGSTNKTTAGDVFENKMSDVVKGTAKPLTREVKQPPPTPQLPAPTTPVEKTPHTPTVVATTSREPTPAQSVPSTSSSPATSQPTAPAPTTTSTPAPTVTMATIAKTPVAKTTVSTSSVVKEKTVNPTVNGLSSLPTPPQSPQKPVKQASLETTSPATKVESSAAPTQSAPAPAPVKQDDASVPIRLSYAQMVQRTKEREAERQKEGGEVTAPASSPAPGAVSKDPTPVAAAASPQTALTSSATTSVAAAAAAVSSAPVRPQALREQSQTSSLPRSPTRAEAPGLLLRKDREDPRDQRLLPARRAKENRDRRGDRDTRLPDRDSRDRFRRNPREGEAPRVLSK